MILKLPQGNMGSPLSQPATRTALKQKGKYPARFGRTKTFPKKRKAIRKLFNRIKTVGTWNEYREPFTAYNKVIRKAERDTWRM